MASETNETKPPPESAQATAEERRRTLVAQFGTDPREMTATFTDGRTTKVIHYANPLDVPARIQTDTRTFFLIEAKPDRLPCPSCGNRNMRNAKTCSACGATIAAQADYEEARPSTGSVLGATR
ncbi:MAG: zinc ribbon domain-containing protein [Candidatus Bathyarchaeia archaeon]|jgi:predicted RNA-binding Zn-ribbon protein involved in translation (DUF1610 family)